MDGWRRVHRMLGVLFLLTIPEPSVSNGPSVGNGIIDARALADNHIVLPGPSGGQVRCADSRRMRPPGIGQPSFADESSEVVLGVARPR